MQRGISYNGFLPVRGEASPSSTMLTQILFGESFNILSSDGSWLLIEFDTGSFEAWVPRDGVHVINDVEELEEESQGMEIMAVHPIVSVRDKQYERDILLPAGSVLKNNDRFAKICEKGWIQAGADIDIKKVGEGLLSIPGLHGGRCGFGFDAPGLVKMLCKCLGIDVPHSITGQSLPGSSINFLSEAQNGDLAFFHNNDDLIIHVGMVLEGGKIIHVTDQVRIDKLDQQGIYCEEKGNYTHQLRVVKSIK